MTPVILDGSCSRSGLAMPRRRGGADFLPVYHSRQTTSSTMLRIEKRLEQVVADEDRPIGREHQGRGRFDGVEDERRRDSNWRSKPGSPVK